MTIPIPIEKNSKVSCANSMRFLEDSNIAPSAPKGGDGSGNGVSFRLRRRSTALGILNRGLANLYNGTSESMLWKDEDEQTDYELKMAVLLKNPHVFDQFKKRVAASEAFANPMAARLVLEDFLQKELMFVGKQGVIHRHSKLIKHLVLTQRSPVGSNTAAPFSWSTSSVQGSILDEKTRQSSARIIKCDSSTADESSGSSFSGDLSNSPTWSPDSGIRMATFSCMKDVSGALQVPNLDMDFEMSEGCFAN